MKLSFFLPTKICTCRTTQKLRTFPDAVIPDAGGVIGGTAKIPAGSKDSKPDIRICRTRFQKSNEFPNHP